MRKLVGGAVTSAVILAEVGLAVLNWQTATVTLHVPLRHVAVYATLTGGEGQGQLPTRPITALVTESRTARSSPFTVSTYARGYVVFSFYNGCLKLCYGEVQLPLGFDVATAAGVHYRTLAQAYFPLMSSSRPTPVIAVDPGPAGNADAGMVTVIGNPGYLTVTNLQPITGGTSHITHVVQQDDYDSLVADLAPKVISDAEYVLHTNAHGLHYAADAPPIVTWTSDHAVGDESPTFTASVTVSMTGYGFSDARARALLRSALSSQLLPGEVLAPRTLSTDYSVLRMTSIGDVEVIGTARGDAIPAVSAAALRQMIAAQSPNQAIGIIEAAVPGAHVDVRLSPSGSRSLPADPRRITIVVSAE